MYDAAASESTRVAHKMGADLVAFLQPLSVRLDAQIDRRLVQAFVRTIDAIIRFRNRPHDVLLSEHAMESVRVWAWERRKKLCLLATLAYAFLVSLLDPTSELLRTWLLHHRCHRTEKRSRATPTPLYRLRSVRSRLWLAYPSRTIAWQSSG